MSILGFHHLESQILIIRDSCAIVHIGQNGYILNLTFEKILFHVNDLVSGALNLHNNTRTLNSKTVHIF